MDYLKIQKKVGKKKFLLAIEQKTELTIRFIHI